MALALSNSYGLQFTFTFYYLVLLCLFTRFRDHHLVVHAMYHLSLDLLVTLLPRHAIALEHAAFCRQVPFSLLSHVLAHDSSGAILRALGRSLGVRAPAQSEQNAWHILDFCRLWARAGFPGGPLVEQYLIHVNAILLAWLLIPNHLHKNPCPPPQ